MATDNNSSKGKAKQLIPSPQMFADATACLKPLAHFDILEYCLGFENSSFPKIMECCVLLSLIIDPSKQEKNLWSEVGFSVVRRKKTQEHIENPGDHSEAMMKSVSFHHMRIKDNMRYLNSVQYATDPNQFRNRFGETRFTEMKEARKEVEDIFRGQPVVLLAFTEQDKSVAFPELLQALPDIFDNFVAIISTQRIARERGIDWNPENPMTFEKLCEYLGYKCQSLDGPSNYAGYNMVAAIQMAMRSRIPLAKISLQTKVHNLELQSQFKEVVYGTKDFCFRCGSDEHSTYNIHGHLKCYMPIDEKCKLSHPIERLSTHSRQTCPHHSWILSSR